MRGVEEGVKQTKGSEDAQLLRWAMLRYAHWVFPIRAHSIPISSPLSHFAHAAVCRITGKRTVKSSSLSTLSFLINKINNYALRRERRLFFFFIIFKIVNIKK
jgi:hypothetical protein